MKKALRAIAQALVNSFISRNNDVCGYWGIGKLYAHMLASGSMELKIDLLTREMAPPNSEFDLLISQVSDSLLSRMTSAGIELNELRKAEITLTGYPDQPSLYNPHLAPNRVQCALVLITGSEMRSSFANNTWCRAHDPNNELKSGRVY